jgi:hypothetical protein
MKMKEKHEENAEKQCGRLLLLGVAAQRRPTSAWRGAKYHCKISTSLRLQLAGEKSKHL